MKAFSSFSLNNPDAIVGGVLVPTHYWDQNGNVYYEWYDTTRERIIHLANS